MRQRTWRIAQLLVAVIAACGLGACARTPPPVATGTPAPVAQIDRADLEPSTVRQHDTVVFERRAAPLGEVLADLLASLPPDSRIDAEIRWEQLRAVGVRRETPVTIHVEQPTLGAVLAAIRQAIGHPRLEYGWDDRGRLMITSARDYIARYAVISEYEVGDLVERDADPGRQDRTIAKFAQEVLDTIAPGSWANETLVEVARRQRVASANSGGGPPRPVPRTSPAPDPTTAHLRWSGFRLIVRQSREYHRQLARFLEQLRETQDRLNVPLQNGELKGDTEESSKGTPRIKGELKGDTQN